jgi:hypothetical protein
MKGDIHAREVLIEGRIKRRNVCRQCKTCRYALSFASIVCEGGVWFQDELIANSELAVGDGVRL